MKLKVLDPRIKEFLPKYATAGSAAFDLRAAIPNKITLLPHQVIKIPTGLALWIEDPTLCGLVFSRSGLGAQGLVLANSVGLIDSDYQGELIVAMKNTSPLPHVIKPLDRIAQMSIMPVLQVQFEMVDDFEESERGSGGFGHTGTN